jgi:hypothetical protein
MPFAAAQTGARDNDVRNLRIFDLGFFHTEDVVISVQIHKI